MKISHQNTFQGQTEAHLRTQYDLIIWFQFIPLNRFPFHTVLLFRVLVKVVCGRCKMTVFKTYTIMALEEKEASFWVTVICSAPLLVWPPVPVLNRLFSSPFLDLNIHLCRSPARIPPLCLTAKEGSAGSHVTLAVVWCSNKVNRTTVPLDLVGQLINSLSVCEILSLFSPAK